MPDAPSATIDFVLNGTPVKVSGVPPATTLLEWLRAEGLTGTKEGCAEGDCGACTIALRTPAEDGQGLLTRAVNACIMPLPMAHGGAVVTVEGIGDHAAPHPVQREMAERHGSQCGFCTPGIVMSLWSREPGEPAGRQETEDRLAGNLCRCTGYGPILEAARHCAAAADELREPARDRETAAMLRAIPPLDYAAQGRRFVAPDTEEAFAQALAENPDATILSGATDVGLWITKSLFDPPVILWTGRVGAFRRLERDGDDLVVGAAVTHSQFHDAVAAHSPQLAELMRRFGGLQVRNAGTVCGNIANGSPIGDLPPALMAAGATLELGHGGGRRTLPLEDYFIAYGKQDSRPGEYVRAVRVPLARLAQLSCHKVSKRFDSDITAVLACIALRIEGGIVDGARIALGGMAATPKRAPHAEAALVGRPYERAEVENAAAALAEDFSPISDQRASAAYRLKVAQNLLRRDFLERTCPDTPTRLAGGAVERVAA